jgi:hypothetical protein
MRNTYLAGEEGKKEKQQQDKASKIGAVVNSGHV